MTSFLSGPGPIGRGITLLCWISATVSAHALTWEKSTVDLALNAGSPDLVVEFPFKNEGAETVTFKDIKASCGCTRATTDSQSVPSGGKGVIKAIYTVGDRTGPQAVQVIVATDEANSTPTILRLNLNIQPLVQLTPRLVQWTKIEGLTPKIIQIKQVGKVAVSKVELGAVGEGVRASLKPGKELGCWELELTPKSIDQQVTAKIEVRVTAGEKSMPYLVYGLVR